MTFKNSMEEAVLAFEASTNRTSASIDQIEQQITQNFENAAPLLDLCRRLRTSQQRLNAIRSDCEKLSQEQDSLKVFLEKYLQPTSQSINDACIARGLPTPRITFASSPIESKVVEAEIQPKINTISKPPIPKKPTTPRKQSFGQRRNQKTVVEEEPEFVQITEEEIENLDTRTMGRVRLQELQAAYQAIWNFYHLTDDKNKEMKRADFKDCEIKLTNLNTVLRYLKVLKRVDLSKEGNIKCLVH